jgi:hypothetical protein
VGDCRPVVDAEAVFYLACAYRVDAVRGLGGVSSVGLDVGDEVEAYLWQTTVIEDDRVTPLLDLDLGMPDRRLVGRLRIDDQRQGTDGRFLGWLRGMIESE